jgi:hypothetical protein
LNWGPTDYDSELIHCCIKTFATNYAHSGPLCFSGLRAIYEPLKLADSTLGERHIAVKIVAVENGLNVSDRMAAYGRNLWHGAVRQREP